VSFEVDLSGDFGNYTDIQGDITINNVVPGSYTIYYSVTDNCGNTAYDQVTVVVEDCKLPTPYCLNGIVVEIMQTGMIQVWASDLNLGSFDNCPGDLTYSFSPNVNDLGVTYTCDDLGQQPVEIWVTDAAGNQDFCETFIVVQDNMGFCGSAPIAVAGLITDENDNGLLDAEVELSSGNMVMTTTDANGAFTFNNLEIGQDYSVTPGLNVDHDNGVSTYDVVLISKHILGVDLLDSPYQIIAADANGSGSVSTLDIVDIRKVILQIVTEFPSNTSWRFVDADYVFPNPMNPFNPGFPEVINFNNLSTSQLATDFVAVKIGDVNNSASTNGLAEVDDRNAAAFALTTTDRNLSEGETFTVDFTAEDLSVLGYQFTLEFDQNVLTLVDLVEGVATEENFGMTHLNQGVVTASWNGVASEGVLFSLEFKANKAAQLSDLLNISSRYTAAEAYTQNGDLLDVNLQFTNGLTAAAGFELYQNVPNPFNGETVVGFNLPEAGTATLSVYDISGKTLKVMRGEFAKGYNTINIRSTELAATGVLYYTLETANETATMKMIIIE
ncbi:MAG: T9SS type A sorting domain-containing protein, partial [Saprospiraceae bacterium]|nr:T9SS type A sorting domain-containing protein [Saprospiraceae bacterium]